MTGSAQIYEFMGCVYAGLMMGLLYGIFDLICSPFRMHRIFTAVTDAIYVLLCICIACIALYRLTYLKVALYHYIGMLLGIFVYIVNTHYIVKKLLHR